MKIIRIIKRSIRDSFKSVVRNFSLSLASISSITITLLVVTLSLLASLNINNFSDNIINDVTVIVFLEKNITNDEIEEAKTNIKQLGNIESIKFISKEENADEMIASSAVFAEYLTPLRDEGNPLYDEFEIKVDDINLIKTTANAINDMETVSSVNYGESIIEKLLNSFSLIEKISYIAVAALVLVTIFLITNTIKLTIYARKEEISIMRLVGASNFSIKMPFIIEGLLLGALGALIPIIVTVYGYTYFFEVNNGVMFSPLFKLIDPNPFVFEISALILGIGFLIGTWGSAKAVRKHMKI